MSKPDFRKGLNIPEMDKERSERAEELQEFLEEQTNNRKKGKAETGRLSIDMAHLLLEYIEEQEEKEKEQLKSTKDLKNHLVENL